MPLSHTHSRTHSRTSRCSRCHYLLPVPVIVLFLSSSPSLLVMAEEVKGEGGSEGVSEGVRKGVSECVSECVSEGVEDELVALLRVELHRGRVPAGLLGEDLTCITASLTHYHDYITTSLHHYFTTALLHYITTPLHHCITASLNHCITTSLHHCITTSLHHCTTSLHH